ncbi:hypothetical protein CCP3SC1AL1_410001 [Gammaproteobacteria bacterium]
MKTLEDRHSAMHESIRKVVTLKKGGNISGAESEYTKLMHLSNEVVTLLRRLEQMSPAPSPKSYVPTLPTPSHVLSVTQSASTPTSHGEGEGKIDFAAARAMHMSCREKPRSFLEGQSKLTEKQVSSHRDCQLGRWLYSHGIARYKHLSEMQTLEKTHAAMHESILKVIRRKATGETANAETEYNQFMRLSGEVVSLLRHLEQTAENAPSTVPTEKNQLVVPPKNGHTLDEWKEF